MAIHAGAARRTALSLWPSDDLRYTANMKCAVCGDPLPSGKKASARYCDDDCRGAAARSRARNRAKRAKQIDSQSDGRGLPADSRPAKQSRRFGSRNSSTKLAVSARDSVVSVPNPIGNARSSTEQPESFRIDLKTQVLRQAPPDAVGYGLVLPASSSDARLKIIPRRKKGEGRTPYRLSPFDYPLDIRLRDATWYRILWFGKGGERIPPPPDSGIPSLYFFLGPPDSRFFFDSSSVDRPLDARETSPDEILSDNGGAPAVPTSPQSELPKVLTEGNEEEESITPASLPEETVPRLSIELLAQCLYEQRVSAAKEQGRTPPPEPLTCLSSDERKWVRRREQSSPFDALGHSFAQSFSSASSEAIDQYIASLRESERPRASDRQLLREVQTTPAKRSYVDYLFLRSAALLSGEPPPVEPKAPLTAQERHRLRKLILHPGSLILLFNRPDLESSG